MTEFGRSICSDCSDNCCRNFFFVFRETQDDDFVQWLSFHEGISVEKSWRGTRVWIHNSCRYLQDNGSCGIYETRPRICREYRCDKMTE